MLFKNSLRNNLLQIVMQAVNRRFHFALHKSVKRSRLRIKRESKKLRTYITSTDLQQANVHAIVIAYSQQIG